MKYGSWVGKKRCFDLIGDGISLGKLFNDLVDGLNEITCFIFDNGSVRPESTLSLRRLAKALELRFGVRVVATSLLHSTRVVSEKLDGVPAVLLEPALAGFGKSGGRRAIALPLFFGQSGALTEYVPERIEALKSSYPELRVELADCLVNRTDDSVDLIARALARNVRKRLELVGIVEGESISVLSTDHGSPKKAVAEIRNLIGARLATILGDVVKRVIAASMERREGDEYAFNEPLLESALANVAADGARTVIVAQQFLQAGRHAGEGGDIAVICDSTERKFPGLSIYRTEVLGGSPEIVTLLERRFREAIKKSTWTQ